LKAILIINLSSGNDVTINEVINGMVELKTTLAIIPYVNTNILAEIIPKALNVIVAS